jgi:ADP-heptose:LPS heptosyltransferase
VDSPRFLISRLSALGDLVCSLPAASALKATWPDCHITWVADPRFAAVADACTAVDEVIRWKPAGLRRLRLEGEFDAAFDLQGLFKSGWVVAGARAKSKLGYHWQREGAQLFSQSVAPDPTSFHVVDQYVDVVRAHGAVADRANFNLKPTEEAVLSVRRKLKERGISGRFVVMNAGAGWATKRWPAGHFAQLIQQLELPVVLVGGPAPADRAAGDEVAAAGALFTNLIGETSVAELIALIRLSSAHVGGDTGSTHLAAAMDIPAIGLYSITRPQRSCPYGQIERCHYDPAGLAQISPEAVLKTLEVAIA